MVGEMGEGEGEGEIGAFESLPPFPPETHTHTQRIHTVPSVTVPCECVLIGWSLLEKLL